MGKSKQLKWHEEIFTGIISAAIGVTLLFNGFSYLASLFINENGIEGKPTKQKALIAFFSIIENSWWKYIIVFIFLLVAFLQIKSGIQKFKEK